MTRSIRAMAVCGLTIALSTLPISSSMAESGGREAEPRGAVEYSGAPNTANPIDDATLEHAAKAFVKVTKIEQSEDRVFNSAGTDTAKLMVARQAESDKLAAVRAEGLQPQQYDQVLQVVRADSNLQQKFSSYIRRGASSPENAM